VEDHPEDPHQAEEDLPSGAPSQHVLATAPADVKHGSTFDLHYLQWSIFLDGCLACLCSFSTQGYHLFIAAGVLPFASGTGAAAKGVTLDFCEASLRADALSAITLVEMLAYICTTGLFGYVFSWLSAVQKPMLLFAANGVRDALYLMLARILTSSTGRRFHCVPLPTAYPHATSRRGSVILTVGRMLKIVHNQYPLYPSHAQCMKYEADCQK
jgi:hypothetical protein